MLATLMPVRKDRGTKAELNRRSQAAEDPGRHRYSCRVNRTGIRVSLPFFRFGRPWRAVIWVYLSTLMPDEMESRAGVAPACMVLQTTA
jgi:hypothetical protein